jgi:hypothetical protein
MPHKPLIQNIFLVLLSCATTFFLIEVILVLVSYPPNIFKGYLLWSTPPFIVDSHGAVTFRPHISIREVAVYNDHIEYDMTYTTNNMGCADFIDYKRCNKELIPTRRYAFVGDSFTAGAGGYNWVSGLRDKLISSGNNIMIYNFGIPGTGLWHFIRLLERASGSLEFTDIVIIAISDDMRRDYWLPFSEKGGIFFCTSDVSKEACLTTNLIATIIEKNATEIEILNQVKQIELDREISEQHSIKGHLREVLKKSRFLRLIAHSLTTFHKEPSNNNIDLTPLKRIKGLFPQCKVHFIHLPQKEEVKQIHYTLDLKTSIEALGIDYYEALTQCSWSMNMFYTNDSHPNGSGYMNISECVGQYLLHSTQ